MDALDLLDQSVRDYSMDPDPLDALDNESSITHYGVKHQSGRYPYGHGEIPYQHEPWFTWAQGGQTIARDSERYRKNKELSDTVNTYRRQGMKDGEIAQKLGYKSATAMRTALSVAKNDNRKADIAVVTKLHAQGKSNSEIEKETGIPRNTVASLLEADRRGSATLNDRLVDRLKDEVSKKKYVYVGLGTEAQLGENGITNSRLQTVLEMLKADGYEVHQIYQNQITNKGQQTTMLVLCPPGTTREEVSKNRGQIRTVTDSEYENRQVRSLGMIPPVAVDSKRVFARDAEHGGSDKDGVIEVRRTAADLNLGPGKAYAQSRILIDTDGDGVGDHYAKGVVVYAPDSDFPPGVDIIVNSHKKGASDDWDKHLKPVKDDPNNPFGAILKRDGGQYYYVDPATGEKKLSAINKVNEEGDWDSWSSQIAAQFLSKQPEKLIQTQLDATISSYHDEIVEINKQDNTVVRNWMLMQFASSTNTNATELHAVGFDRQTTKLIVPSGTLKPNEIYAPGYRDGEEVITIRYPHAGDFEIVRSRVNNKDKTCKEIYGNITDAVAIPSSSAKQMSGADYDGDFVIVIPITGKEKEFSMSPPRFELADFDTDQWAKTDDQPRTGKDRETVSGKVFNKGLEMGKITNLITDMTARRAPIDDIVRADKCSMVIIDAEKHNLDWEAALEAYGISELQEKYQKKGGGATTFISRSRSPEYVPERSPVKYHIEKDTGVITYEETGRTYTDKDGKVHPAQSKISKTQLVHERGGSARELMSSEQGFAVERMYADFSDECYRIANDARRQAANDNSYYYSEEAATKYAQEVRSIKAKLLTAKKNKPYENLAQIRAQEIYREAVKNLKTENMTNSEIKEAKSKLRQQALLGARADVGSQKQYVELTEKEVEAINAGAVKKTLVTEVLDNSRADTVMKEFSMKPRVSISPGVIALVKQLNRVKNGQGYTIAEIADRVGLSPSQVAEIIRGEHD